MTRIVLAGGSGFLGRALASYFQRRGHEVIILTRFPKQTTHGVREISWNAGTLGDWVRELDGASVVINLTGRLVNCRYNHLNRKLILESRVRSTQIIGEAMARCKTPPNVWLNASTATIYQHTHGPAWNESGEIASTPEAKDEFSIRVATAWEQALNETKALASRKVVLRTAMVLGANKNSVFPMLRRLTRFGLGGKMGSGRQYVSWIHETDFCRAVEWLLTHDEFSGPVNVCAPQPIPNAEMMKTFREVCGVPFGLPATRWMLEAGAFMLQTETELIIKSRYVVPHRLLKSGFEFCFPLLRPALENLKTKMEG